MPPTDGSVQAAATVLRWDGGALAAERALPEEVGVEVVYGTLPFAVMMMTPNDLEDFAAGFSLTEGIVAGGADIRGVTVEQPDGGLRLVVDLAPTAFHAHLSRRRMLSGRTGCGVCGVESLAALPQADTVDRPAPNLSADAIRRALDAMERQQVLNQATGAVHAAGFAAPDGRVLLVREDVGRHNALDKLIGAAMRAGIDPANGFVLVTSRASFEMVEKVASFGGHALVAISMPTSLALERARRHGIALVGVARRDSMTIFHGADRITAERAAA